MSRRSPKSSRKMPILGGFVIGRGRSAQTLLKGDYVLHEGQARQVQKLFVDSAKFTGHRPPRDFRLKGGEIFYEGGKIVEIRIVGAPSNNEAGEVSPSWRLGRLPIFTVTGDVRLIPSKQDRGRAHLLALAFRKILILSWDVTANANLPSAAPGAMDIRLIRMSTPPASPPWKFDTGIKSLDWIIKAARDMKRVLTQMREGAVFEYSDAFMQFCQVFMPFPRGLVSYAQDGPAQEASLTDELVEVTFTMRLLKLISESASDPLSHRRGRVYGSKNTKRRTVDAVKREQIRKKQLERKERIIKEMKLLYKEFRAEELAEVEAEFRITRKLVAGRVGKSPGTLHYWLRQGDLDFEKLRGEACQIAEEEIGR